MSTTNDQHNTLNGPSALQVVSQRQHISTTTTVNTHGHQQTVKVVDDYPLQLTSDYREGVQSNGDYGFWLHGVADLAFKRQVTVSAGGNDAANADQGDADTSQSSRRVVDHITADALLVRDLKTGANLVADGRDSERYLAVTPDGCYNHLLRAQHGYVTTDRLSHECANEGDPGT